MQQLFATLQEERKLHQEKLAELTIRMAKLQQDNDKSRNQVDAKTTVISDIPNTITTTQMNVATSSSLQPDAPNKTPGAISATMETMLEKFSELDEDSKKALMHHAITSNNEALQSRLMKLHESSGNNYSIAKLTKEIIKLAETYKVPELKFDEQAQRRRFNFHSWIMKLKPILAMFPQTSKVLPGDTVIPFTDPHHIGNRALYLLLCSRIDPNFQRAIKEYEPFEDKALELIQRKCAHISNMDKLQFHENFTGLSIKENESATSFLKRFTYGKTTAEAALNTYSEEQLIDFVLAGLRHTQKYVYRTAIQLYQLER
jgi:hypothetical protein